MRVWDQIDPSQLCRQHLLGEHREVHCIYTVLTEDYSSRGYRHHPEVRRWRGFVPALVARHDALVAEMTRRGYNHQSPLKPVDGMLNRPPAIDNQLAKLRAKGCDCKLTKGK